MAQIHFLWRLRHNTANSRPLCLIRLGQWPKSKNQVPRSAHLISFTVPARQAKAKELLDGGMSQREAAKELGVSAATINADVQKLNAQRSEPEPSSTRALLSQSDQNDWRTPRKYLDAARAVPLGGHLLRMPCTGFLA